MLITREWFTNDNISRCSVGKAAVSYVHILNGVSNSGSFGFHFGCFG